MPFKLQDAARNPRILDRFIKLQLLGPNPTISNPEALNPNLRAAPAIAGFLEVSGLPGPLSRQRRREKSSLQSVLVTSSTMLMIPKFRLSASMTFYESLCKKIIEGQSGPDLRHSYLKLATS